MRHSFYLIYGLLVLGLMGAAEYSGWSLLSVNQIKNVPKTVRDNPGAYRYHLPLQPPLRWRKVTCPNSCRLHPERAWCSPSSAS